MDDIWGSLLPLYLILAGALLKAYTTTLATDEKALDFLPDGSSSNPLRQVGQP